MEKLAVKLHFNNQIRRRTFRKHSLTYSLLRHEIANFSNTQCCFCGLCQHPLFRRTSRGTHAWIRYFSKTCRYQHLPTCRSKDMCSNNRISGEDSEGIVGKRKRRYERRKKKKQVLHKRQHLKLTREITKKRSKKN